MLDPGRCNLLSKNLDSNLVLLVCLGWHPRFCCWCCCRLRVLVSIWRLLWYSVQSSRYDGMPFHVHLSHQDPCVWMSCLDSMYFMQESSLPGCITLAVAEWFLYYIYIAAISQDDGKCAILCCALFWYCFCCCCCEWTIVCPLLMELYMHGACIWCSC